MKTRRSFGLVIAVFCWGSCIGTIPSVAADNRWTQEFAQGQIENMIRNQSGSYVNVACDANDPDADLFMSVQIKGKAISGQHAYQFIIGGESHVIALTDGSTSPPLTRSEGNDLANVVSALRNAKSETFTVQIPDTKASEIFSLTNAKDTVGKPCGATSSQAASPVKSTGQPTTPANTNSVRPPSNVAQNSTVPNRSGPQQPVTPTHQQPINVYLKNCGPQPRGAITEAQRQWSACYDEQKRELHSAWAKVPMLDGCPTTQERHVLQKLEVGIAPDDAALADSLKPCLKSIQVALQQKAAKENEQKERQRVEEEQQRKEKAFAESPAGRLGELYIKMQALSRCVKARQGFAMVYISEPEYAEAQKIAKATESKLKPTLSAEDTKTLWTNASVAVDEYEKNTRAMYGASYDRDTCLPWLQIVRDIGDAVLGKQAVKKDF